MVQLAELVTAGGHDHTPGLQRPADRRFGAIRCIQSAPASPSSRHVRLNPRVWWPRAVGRPPNVGDLACPGPDACEKQERSERERHRTGELR